MSPALGYRAPMPETKVCSRCGVERPIEEFPLGNKGKGRRLRPYAYCKPCHAAYQGENRLRYVFDLKNGDYDIILRHQGGTCAICERTTADARGARLSVDHDHKTGLVRGLLCTYHNRMLGQMTPDIVAALHTYLQNPPASTALGYEHFTTPGGSQTKKRRALRAKERRRPKK